MRTLQGDLLPLLISRQFKGVTATFGSKVEEIASISVNTTVPKELGLPRTHAGKHVDVVGVMVQLQRVQQRSRQPCHEVPNVHSGGGGKAVP